MSAEGTASVAEALMHRRRMWASGQDCEVHGKGVTHGVGVAVVPAVEERPPVEASVTAALP